VDIGGTNLAAGAVDAQGKILSRVTVMTARDQGAEAILDQIVQCVLSLCADAQIASGTVRGVGLAVPGWVDEERVYMTPNVPLSGFALARPVQERTGLPVRMENDANCALLGEAAFGAAKNLSDVVMLTVGTGLGSAIRIHGKLLRPSGGAEIGHTVLCKDGIRCGCGRRGCAEGYTSVTALIRMARQSAGRYPDSLLTGAGKLSGKTIFMVANQKDPAALAALERYFDYFSELLMNCVMVFRPQAILLGGGLSGAGEAFFAPLCERLYDPARMGHYCAGEMPRLIPASLGNDAGILGAARLFDENTDAGE
jgi:glucokinase